MRIIHGLSSKVHLKDLKADVIVSETLGALMLGEGAQMRFSKATLKP